MSSARVEAFAQRVARTIVQREVAVAHEGDDFQNMNVLVSLLLYTWVFVHQHYFFPFSSCLGHTPRSPYALLSANSTRKMQHALRSSTLRGCVSAPLIYRLSALRIDCGGRSSSWLPHPPRGCRGYRRRYWPPTREAQAHPIYKRLVARHLNDVTTFPQTSKLFSP